MRVNCRSHRYPTTTTTTPSPFCPSSAPPPPPPPPPPPNMGHRECAERRSFQPDAVSLRAGRQLWQFWLRNGTRRQYRRYLRMRQPPSSRPYTICGIDASPCGGLMERWPCVQGESFRNTCLTGSSPPLPPSPQLNSIRNVSTISELTI